MCGEPGLQRSMIEFQIRWLTTTESVIEAWIK
jgi:hypothetical protein